MPDEAPFTIATFLVLCSFMPCLPPIP
jgi:hypothetical protein